MRVYLIIYIYIYIYIWRSWSSPKPGARRNGFSLKYFAKKKKKKGQYYPPKCIKWMKWKRSEMEKIIFRCFMLGPPIYGCNKGKLPIFFLVGSIYPSFKKAILNDGDVVDRTFNFKVWMPRIVIKNEITGLWGVSVMKGFNKISLKKSDT